MKMKCNTLTILVFLLAGTMLIAAPTKSEFERTIQKDFQIDSDGLVDLSNKYGKVTIETVSGNTVNIEVVIKVDANSQSKADEIFDRIDIDFTNNGSLVKAETTIASQKSKWFSWWGDSKSNSLEINYTVKMPKSCRLSLMNKYGDNFVDHLDGKANISVKYGNLQLAGISGDRRFAEQTPDTYHKVRRGDSLSAIARKYRTNVSELVALNGLKSRNRIRVGQVLRLPYSGPPMS